MNLSLATILTNLIVLLIAFPLHEFAHAWSANAFGDDTPRRMGRLTLNPLKHLDLFGSLMLLVAGFGWAKPVPVNPYALERHSRSALMWVSLAGPLSNLALALLAVLPFRLGFLSISSIEFSTTFPSLGQFLFYFIYINLLLALFNLIPLAPLDGEKVLMFFAPRSLAKTLDQLRPYQPIFLMAVVFLAARTGLLYLPLNWLMGLLLG